MAEITNVLLVGPSGVGKSTLLARVVERLASTRTVRGFLSESQREGEHRLGWRIDACDRSDGGMFATREMESEFRMGPYGCDMPLYERIALAQLTPLDANVLYVIDEIGFAPEWSAPAFEAQQAVLDSPALVLAIARYRDDGRTPHAEAAKRRADVELVEVSLENRDSLVDVLVKRFSG
jgi:nucleoside-triphosphatase THEP1